MKTSILILLALGLTGIGRAQEESAPAEPVDSTPTIVYEAPVVYQAPVIYQEPVVYEAPVYYAASAPPPCPPPACEAPSTVIYIGNGCPSSTSNCSRSGSTLIHFGCGQAYSGGYQFNHPR